MINQEYTKNYHRKSKSANFKLRTDEEREKYYDFIALAFANGLCGKQAFFKLIDKALEDQAL